MDHRDIELKIRRLLVDEKRAMSLSNKLFSPPDGLFCQLARIKEERRKIVETPLFKEAQERIHELERRDAAEFAAAFKDLLNKPEMRGARIYLDESGGS